MHGLKGGRWRSGSHGEPDDAHPPGNQAGLSPTTYRVPTNQRPTSLRRPLLSRRATATSRDGSSCAAGFASPVTLAWFVDSGPSFAALIAPHIT